MWLKYGKKEQKRFVVARRIKKKNPVSEMDQSENTKQRVHFIG